MEKIKYSTNRVTY